MFVCLFVGLRTPVVCGGLRLTKDGTYATQGRPKRASLKAGRRVPFRAPDTDPSLSKGARGHFALQGPCPY